MACIAGGMAWFSGLHAGGSFASDVLGPSLLTGLGIGLSFVPVTVAAMSGVERTKAGLASGLVNTSRQLGGSLGLAILATLAAQRSHHGSLVDGYHLAFVVGACFALAGALSALVGLAGRREPLPAPAAS
jgi:sugar phosphate permease